MKNVLKASLWAVSFSFLALNVSAQTCGTQPTCESLGYIYNEKNCPKDSRISLRCPLDLSAYWCDDPIIPTCATGGYVDACPSGQTGTQISYSGLTCYKNCINPAQILYSDKTVSTEVISGKTPIGIVFDPEKKLAFALETSLLEWGGYGKDIPTLENCDYYNYNFSSCDPDGKENTAKIIAYGKENNISYPAAEYCNNYTTAGTKAGDWYLPSINELNTIYYGKLNTFYPTLRLLGKEFAITSYWSSNERYSNASWGIYSEDWQYYHNKNEKLYVRPVLAF